MVFLQDYERVNFDQPDLLQTNLGKAMKRLVTDQDMKPRMRVRERVLNIMAHTRKLNGMLMFPTLMSKTDLLHTLCNMNYHANFLYRDIGIQAETANFTTSTGNLIDKLMDEPHVTDQRSILICLFKYCQKTPIPPTCQKF